MAGKNIKEREYIHGTHVRSSNDFNSDCLFVKERIVFDDDTTIDNFRKIENYIKPYWITKREYRDHEQKKEFELKKHCEEFHTNTSRLPAEAAKRLGIRKQGYIGLRDVAESPYLYGCDVSVNALVKKDYQDKWPDAGSKSTLAVLDYETDVVNGTERIISGAISQGEKAFLSVTADFIQMSKEDLTYEMDVQLRKLKLPDGRSVKELLDERNINIELDVVKDDFEVTRGCIGKAHEWGPDFVGIWNSPFDIGKMELACMHKGVDGKHLFSDPSVPAEYKYYDFRKEKANKVTAEGKSTNKHHADLWHVLTAPAKFMVIDLMTLRRKMRMRDPYEPSYALDAITKKELDMGKLGIPEADHLDGLEWHIFMQRYHKVEYIIYNLIDVVICEMLDEKTNDVALGLRSLVGVSELTAVSSGTRQLADDFHFVLQEDNKVICSTSKDMSDEISEHLPSLRGWVDK